MGPAKAFLHGQVYHLTRVADFAGVYGVAEIGFTVLGGQAERVMRNQHGVTISLASVERGVQLTIGVAGVAIELEPKPDSFPQRRTGREAGQ